VTVDFARSTDPYRRELLAYCYRMLGSVHDAEDLVQETLLRAWRSFDRYDAGRASLRTWLYRIATNACLTALEQVGRRALPAELYEPTTGTDRLPTRPRQEPLWLQPVPDALLDPALVADARGGIRLAFITALQHLPARQRAVLILRDVLAWRAAEVAELLDTSVAAVNSALQRARDQLATLAPDADTVTEPDDATRRQVLDRYVTAFVNADLDGLIQLLRDDVELEMPPHETWFAGRDAVAGFVTARFRLGHDRRLVPTAANGQPAVAMYLPDGAGGFHCHSLHVLTVAGTRIARIVAFLDGTLFPTFGLPETLTRG
jgi:RNA polymerase sigma-70 factor, ECF subfamily